MRTAIPPVPRRARHPRDLRNPHSDNAETTVRRKGKKLPVLWLMDNVVNRASSCSSSTTTQCAFLTAIACASPNRSAGSRSYRSAGNGAASYGCQTEHQKAHYRRYYLCFHLLPPLDVVTDPSLTTGR